MKTYSIREISDLFSVPSSTLRYYESEGLLVNVQRNASGPRVYTEEHKIIGLLEAQEQCVSEQLSHLKEDFLHIQRKVNYYKTVKKSFEQGTPRPHWTECEEKAPAR